MNREIKITYEPVENKKARIDQIAEIIGRGIFCFLKKNGYLRNKIDQDKVYQVIEKSKNILEKSRVSNLLEL